MMPNDRTTAPLWSIYLLRCGNGALYTGIATDVTRRLSEHRRNKGKTAKYLRGKGPLELVLEKPIGPKGLALRIEKRIKRLPKARKERLIGKEGTFEQMVKQVEGDLSRRPGSG